ncbi:MAG: DUF87 domain-containing protein, partial [Candidatus Micrarchaeota archaeon]|nr:DUF87 domain-containing protein [Candidatus Micrarchaeota archaeon]
MDIMGSGIASEFIFISKSPEPELRTIKESIKSGIFLGNSNIYSMPVLLDPFSTINPHILIVGMTGSGKTFLMRNLILRLSTIDESKIVLIDFTGEYKEQLKGLLSEPKEIDQDSNTSSQIDYFNFSKESEQEKVHAAANVLSQSLTVMRKREIGSKKRIFIVLDEAWKLLKREKSLETIVR